MAIKINSLCKSFGGRLVLDNINLHVKKGRIFGLLGVNGAGKTTLVSILNYLTFFDKGTIEIMGKEFVQNEKLIKSSSSFVPQSFAFYPNLTAYENLEFFGSLYGLRGEKLKNQIKKVLHVSSLEKEAHIRARKYSGGYKRRLNLAIGLLNEPQILYLDEPTTGVDAHTRAGILQTIKDLRKDFQTSIVYTSHYMEEIEHICDDIAILDKGKIILQDTKDELLKKHVTLEYLFLQLTKEDILV